MVLINGSPEVVIFTDDLIIEGFKLHLIAFLSSRPSVFLVLTLVCLALITDHQKWLEKFQVAHLNDRDCLLLLISILSEDILQTPSRKLFTSQPQIKSNANPKMVLLVWGTLHTN